MRFEIRMVVETGELLPTAAEMTQASLESVQAADAVLGLVGCKVETWGLHGAHARVNTG